MPRMTIEMLEGRTLNQKRAIAEAFADAVAECYGLPRGAGLVRFIEVKLEDFASNGELRWDTSLREGYPVYGKLLEPRITIQCLTYYTTEMKKKLVKRVTEKICEILGSEPCDVKIYLQEMQNHQYAAAGVLASDSIPAEHKK